MEIPGINKEFIGSRKQIIIFLHDLEWHFKWTNTQRVKMQVHKNTKQIQVKTIFDFNCRKIRVVKWEKYTCHNQIILLTKYGRVLSTINADCLMSFTKKRLNRKKRIRVMQNVLLFWHPDVYSIFHFYSFWELILKSEKPTEFNTIGYRYWGDIYTVKPVKTELTGRRKKSRFGHFRLNRYSCMVFLIAGTYNCSVRS